MKVICPIESQNLRRIGESLTLHRKGNRRPHKGVDLFAAAGTAVLAPVKGQVLRVVNGLAGRKSQQRAGWFVDIAGDDGRVYRLLHLGSEIAVKEGTRVSAGQPIGSVGARGTSGVLHAQPHLHFEIALSDYDSSRQDYGERIDPLTVLHLEQHPNKELAMDIDWKGILDKAIDIGGPVLGAAINAEAPGAGTAVAAGMPLLKNYVVDPYVPGTSPAPAAIANAPAPPAMAAPALASPEQQTAASVLQSKGWSPAQVQQHLQSPNAASTPLAALPAVAPDHGALLVHGVLHEAGWHPAARQAILRGPYAFADYMKPAQHVPDQDELARLEDYDPDAILRANLHYATERGGHSPTLYHGTDDAQVAGLGETTEHPGTKET